MQKLVNFLNEKDRLSIVVFNHYSEISIHLTQMNDSGKNKILDWLKLKHTGGSTNIASGLKNACIELKNRKKKNHVTSILLLSDGRDDYGT